MRARLVLDDGRTVVVDLPDNWPDLPDETRLSVLRPHLDRMNGSGPES